MRNTLRTDFDITPRRDAKAALLRAVPILAALLLVGAGCSAPAGLSLQSGSQCVNLANQRKQADLAAEPKTQALNEDTHYNNTLKACLYTVEYAGKMQKYPDASWVVDSLIINTETGKTLAEYLTVDGVQKSPMDFAGFDAAKAKLFSQ